VDRPLQKIREFRNRPNPKIVVSVDMLTTGVDIPSLEFIVFMRPVKSRILWVQMLGRGTRKCDLINKEKFVIFDCFDGTLIEYFKNTTDFEVQLPQKDPVPLGQVIENIYQNIDREYHIKVLVKRLHRIDRTMSGAAREKLSLYIPDGDLGRFARELPGNIGKEFTKTLALLRDKDFQEVLLNYERAKRTFLVGYEIEDDVSSDVMIRMGSDYQKPEDYLDAFVRFVRGNPDHIEAIKILMERPKQWNTRALKELREKLRLNKFDEKELQRAHQLIYKKVLADIISMVKHAARQEEPITSAQERVDSAIARVTAGAALTDEQTAWMGYIRQHLIANLTIDLEDFDYIPALEQHGGRARAKKVFGDDLERLIIDINYAIAA
jgi:type I restriction enzyme R subunit